MKASRIRVWCAALYSVQLTYYVCGVWCVLSVVYVQNTLHFIATHERNQKHVVLISNF